MHGVFLSIFLILAITIIVLIMLQQCKETSFLGSAANKLFNSSNSGNFMTRITAVLVAIFFIISLLLANINSNSSKEKEWANINFPIKNKQVDPLTSNEVTNRNIPQ